MDIVIKDMADLDTFKKKAERGEFKSDALLEYGGITWFGSHVFLSTDETKADGVSVSPSMAHYLDEVFAILGATVSITASKDHFMKGCTFVIDSEGMTVNDGKKLKYKYEDRCNCRFLKTIYKTRNPYFIVPILLDNDPSYEDKYIKEAMMKTGCWN